MPPVDVVDQNAVGIEGPQLVFFRPEKTPERVLAWDSQDLITVQHALAGDVAMFHHDPVGTIETKGECPGFGQSIGLAPYPPVRPRVNRRSSHRKENNDAKRRRLPLYCRNRTEVGHLNVLSSKWDPPCRFSTMSGLYEKVGSCTMSSAGTGSSGSPARFQALSPPAITDTR